MTGRPTLGDWGRAVRRIGGALRARTGPRTPFRSHNLVLIGSVAAAALGGAAGAAAIGGDGLAHGTDRAAIEAVVRDYILAHPEIIPEAMERLRERETRNSIDSNRTAIETPYAGAWDGAKDGDVVLVEFFDYACGYCRASVPDVERLLKEDKRLKVVYRELPILGADSVLAARVGLLAAESGVYPAFHRAIYKGDVSRAGIVAAADAAGLDKAKVQAALAVRQMPKELTSNVSLAQALGARGTPMFVVGDQVLNGAVGFDELQAAVARARAGKSTR